MLDVLMIDKNEFEGIQVTLNSLQKYQFNGRIFIYDTGSEDGTQDKAKEIGQDKVIIGSGSFDNFAQARNDAQSWALSLAPDIEWILWLDANDTISAPPFVPDTVNFDAYLICQMWFPGPTKFYNTRIYKLSADTLWFGYVHEWVKFPANYRTKVWSQEEFAIHQNRLKNSESSKARWHKDVELLTRQVNDAPNESRYYFYLGRALKDIGKFDEAQKYFEKRLTFDNFAEERYWTLYYLAEMEQDWEKKISLFLRAFDECGRVETLVAAGRLLIDKHKWYRAFMVLNTAIEMPFPDDATLFIQVEDYDYARWHLIGICAYYIKQYKIGAKACKKAILKRKEPIDVDNLKWYTSRATL